MDEKQATDITPELGDLVTGYARGYRDAINDLTQSRLELAAIQNQPASFGSFIIPFLVFIAVYMVLFHATD